MDQKEFTKQLVQKAEMMEKKDFRAIVKQFDIEQKKMLFVETWQEEIEHFSKKFNPSTYAKVLEVCEEVRKRTFSSSTPSTPSTLKKSASEATSEKKKKKKKKKKSKSSSSSSSSSS